jgi:predicted nucleic acid-binding Zn ribbon protein
MNKNKISFFENILYWFWYYNKKMGDWYPWRGAKADVGLFVFFNITFIPFVILNILGYNGYMVMIIFPVIIIFFGIKYNDRKYCIVRDKHTNSKVWSEKYCILSERYDNMSYKQRRKQKRIFIIYVISTILITVLTLSLTSMLK